MSQETDFREAMRRHVKYTALHDRADNLLSLQWEASTDQQRFDLLFAVCFALDERCAALAKRVSFLEAAQ